MNILKFPLKVILIAFISTTSLVTAQAHDGDHNGPEAKPVLLKDLSDLPGKEALMLTVKYKPGEIEIPHRHEAHCFLYVTEGTVIMGVKGGKEVTLNVGDTFYEGPEDVHTVGRNASKTLPAKFVVLLIKNKGVDAVLPVK